MIDAKMIPDEVVEAARREHTDGYAETWDERYRNTIAAALNAWPNWYGTWDEDATGVYRTIILPLPKDAADE